MKQVININFSKAYNYDQLSDAVIMWALRRYGKRIAEYDALPWWKKFFRRNPTFILKRNCDDLFSSPPVWDMKLKTIDGTYRVKAVFANGLSTKYMQENEYFIAALLLK